VGRSIGVGTTVDNAGREICPAGDRVDLHEDFDPRRHYTLTLSESEMSVVERGATSAASVDDIDL
jgi:hypothetical protein